MSENPQAYVDNILVVWGERYDWSPRFKKSKGAKTQLPRVRAIPASGRPVTAARVRATLRAFVRGAPQALVKISGGAKGMGGIRANIAYIAQIGRAHV